MKSLTPPVILCFSGLDPSGGAGIQADIEAISQHSCHAAPIITANTVQNTLNVIRFETVDEKLLREQAMTILNDMTVSAIKIGMIGSAQIAEAIYSVLLEKQDIPVIFDPVLAAGGGTSLAHDQLIDAINTLIIPHTHLLTPNTTEALQLTDINDSTSDAAKKLNIMGADYVLLTGTHSHTPTVIHDLYHQSKKLKSFEYKRLNNEYHGSGCTLASSLAAQITIQSDVIKSCQNALDYTFNSLLNAQPLGNGQLIPRRII